jgi:hypothetical protein
MDLGAVLPRRPAVVLVSAALAAQLAGDFRVAVVQPRPPSAAVELVLAGYAGEVHVLPAESRARPGT